MQFTTVQYRRFVSQRQFGVELELSEKVPKARVKRVVEQASPKRTFVSKYSLSTNNTYWHIKDDATCGTHGREGPKGVEVASFVGRGIADLQHIADVACRLKEAGCEVNDNCGLHIHADAKDLTGQQMGRILAHWLKIESILGIILPPHRRSNEYCRFMEERCHWSFDRSKRYTPSQVYDLFRPHNLCYYENPDRRVTLNLVNYERANTYGFTERKTIEFRWPEGTLSGTDIKCWVRLFLHFIDHCKNRPMPANLEPVSIVTALQYLGLHHEGSNFLILSEGLHETKTWMLERLLRYNRGERYGSINVAKAILNDMWEPVKKYA